MTTHRYGNPCPLCPELLIVEVNRLTSAQDDFTIRVNVVGRHCPGCETARPQQWVEAMRAIYGD